MRPRITNRDPFKCFKTSPGIIRFPLSLRNVEGLLHGRGVDISRETVRCRWHRFGLLFAAEIRKRRVASWW